MPILKCGCGQGCGYSRNPQRSTEKSKIHREILKSEEKSKIQKTYRNLVKSNQKSKNPLNFEI